MSKGKCLRWILIAYSNIHVCHWVCFFLQFSFWIEPKPTSAFKAMLCLFENLPRVHWELKLQFLGIESLCYHMYIFLLLFLYILNPSQLSSTQFVWLKAESTLQAVILEKSLHVNCWTLDFIYACNLQTHCKNKLVALCWVNSVAEKKGCSF